MAILSDFTTFDEIRATLGVSAEELEDVTLALPIYYRGLSYEFYDLATDIEDYYLTAWSLPASSRSTAQQRYFDAVQLYSAFSASKQLLTSLPLFAPKTITDGRAEVTRQNDPFADVRDGINAGLALARTRLLAAYETLTSVSIATTYALPTLITSTGLAIDPVTGA